MPLPPVQVDAVTAAEERVRAFIYDRHATTTTVILDIRLDRCRAYAESRGWDIAGVWVDLGNHALGSYRPQLKGLCAAMELESGPVLCLVDDWDRFSRDGSHSAVMRNRITQAGGHCETVDGETDALDAGTQPEQLHESH